MQQMQYSTHKIAFMFFKIFATVTYVTAPRQDILLVIGPRIISHLGTSPLPNRASSTLTEQ